MDVLNLLIENGADLTKRNPLDMNCFDEIVKTDDLDLFECVYPLTRNLKRNLKEVSRLCS